MRPVDSGPSSPGGCTSTCLMCLAQLGHCSTRAKCCHAFSSGNSTVNSRRNSVIIAVLPCRRTQASLRLLVRRQRFHRSITQRLPVEDELAFVVGGKERQERVQHLVEAVGLEAIEVM